MNNTISSENSYEKKVDSVNRSYRHNVARSLIRLLMLAVNSVKQIHAIVDGKAVVISESSVRNDLLFNDEDGITYLTNDDIFENLALIGYEQLSTKLTFQKGRLVVGDLAGAAPAVGNMRGAEMEARGESNKTNPMFKDGDFDGLDDDMENVEGETVYAATSGVSTARALVSTARPTVSTIGPSTSVAGTSAEQRRLTTPPPSQPSDTKDKGKGIMVEPDPLAQQEREREQFTIEERAQFLVETIAAQRKFRAAQRAVEIISKPPTKTQLRNMMITYLKNMDSEKEETKSVEPESEGKKGKRIKRVADSALKHKSSKKQKMMQEQESAKSDEDATADYEHEKEELRMWLTVVPDKEETVHPEILFAKYPIVDWESQNLGNVDMEDLHIYKIIRADGNTVSHNYYSISRVHTLLMDGTLTCFNMLVEKNYPLIKELLEKMLNWKLEAEAESTMAFELLKFIKSQLED
ncbi:hypothetical protein Tco_0123680 [Tanacetum coccineum]